MTITVVDSASAMRRVLDATGPDRTGLVREMWAPMAGMYRFFPGEVDLAAAHRQSFGFDWDGAPDAVRSGLDALVAADAWARTERALEDGVAALRSADPAAVVPDLTVLLVLGDPADEHFTSEVQGLSAFGGISGFIAITVWPTPRVVDRLEAIVAHELHHNVRYSPGGVVWDPMTVTVGEQVVSEGLADVFAAESYGDAGYTHFVADDAWTDAVLGKVESGLEITGMERFTAWVHGDASARRFGVDPVGLPTGAGYAAGVRLVRAFLEETGTTAAQHVRTPSVEILAAARRRAGSAPDA